MPVMQAASQRTPLREFWRRFRQQPVAMASGIFVLLLIVVAVAAPWIAPFDAENYFDYDRLNDGPSLIHWFGVDSLGRDIFSRVLVGAQISLTAGVFAVLIGSLIGTVLGLVAGYYEGWWDRIIMRICDVLFAFPGILLAIAVVAIMGSGMTNVIIAVAICPPGARQYAGSQATDLYRVGAQHWRQRQRNHFPAYSAGDGIVDCGLFHHAYWRIDYLCRQPVVPWPGGTTANAGMGRDAQ